MISSWWHGTRSGSRIFRHALPGTPGVPSGVIVADLTNKADLAAKRFSKISCTIPMYAYGSATICWQIDSLEIPTLNQREEIRSKASNQDGGLDLDQWNAEELPRHSGRT